MNTLLDILYIYIIVYALYFIYTTIKNLGNKKFRIIQKYKMTARKKNLCLIVYTHNNKKTLKRMLECLKKQDYPTENTCIFVIMDNCTDGSENLEFAPNVQKFIIKNQGVVGKKQAINILVEKLHAYSGIEAFVFLNINRYIEPDFLTSVNASLADYDVVSGATILFGERLSIRQRIKSAYQKYKMNFLERSRASADLYTIVDSDVCAVKRTIVEENGIPDFENLESDLQYSLNLAREGVQFTFNHNIKTYCEVHSFRIRIPRFSKRFSLFANSVGTLFSGKSKYWEFTFFQLCPNSVCILMILALLATYPLDYCFLADFNVIISVICSLVICFALSLIKSKMRSREVFALALYPLYAFFHFLKHFFLWRFIKRWVCKEIPAPVPEETYEIEAEVTDGRGVAPCRLVIVNECGMTKVRFLFKNKKIVTKAHLRIYDAIEEIIKKLAEYGFTIKICQACANFTSHHDGSTNLIKGFCKRQFQMSQQAALPVVVWNSCKGFSPRVIVKNYRG